MTGLKTKIYRRIAVSGAALLFLASAFYPATAEAYIARSTGSVTSYGIARSTGSTSAYYRPAPAPQQPTQPAPAPTPPPAPAPSPAPVPAPQQPAQPAPRQPGQSITVPSGSVTLNSQEQLLLNLVNAERVKAGLKPLILDSRLTRLARLKSQDMINNRYFAHESPVYGRSGDMLRSAGYIFSLAAENIGVGGDVRAIFSAFMNSSGHRSKILGSRYTHTGVGIIYQPGRGYLVTQLFVLPK